MNCPMCGENMDQKAFNFGIGSSGTFICHTCKVKMSIYIEELSYLEARNCMTDEELRENYPDDVRVYCTDCKHFNIEEETPTCKYELSCDIYDCEDSVPFSERPYYEE